MNNNRETITHPDNQTFYYSFDGLDRVRGVSTTTFNTEGLLGVRYQANGRRQNILRPNGSTTTYNFNNGVQLSSYSQTFVSNSFGSGSNNTTTRFEYNAAGQITLMGQSNKTYSYTGNEDRTGTYTPDGLNRYTKIGGTSLDYDANSNLIKDGLNSYTYDDENRLLTAGSAQFLYDPNGRLFQYVANGNVRQFVYDGDALIGDYFNGTLENRFVHGDQVDEPWVRFRGSKITDDVKFYLHSNQQGSIIAESSQTGSGSGWVTSTLAYDAFGIAGQNNVGVFGYTGQMYLKELGLYYYKARIYSPKLGRFLQTDPIGYKDDMNLYAYVGNDPVNKTDPTGMYTCDGTASQCSQLKNDLKVVNAALKSGKLDKEQTTKLTAINKSIGKDGEKNGVKISFGGLKSGGTAEFAGPGKDADSSRGLIRVDRSKASDELAAGSSISHEVDHMHTFEKRGKRGSASRAEALEDERSAYKVNATIYQGHGYGVTEKSINKAVNQSVDDWCERSSAPGC